MANLQLPTEAASLASIAESLVKLVTRAEAQDAAARIAVGASERALRVAIANAMRELGEPTKDYPAPVANAHAILKAALDA